MTCARREAGAQRPAPSAGSPSGSDPHPGRRRARFSLLPALAILLGALGLFAAAPAQAQTTVTLSASPNPVTEGDIVVFTLTLSQTLSSNVTIPLTFTAGTAETGDYVEGLLSLTVQAGLLQVGGGILTLHDTDEDDETFTVALGTLPSGLTAGSPSSVTVTIWDDDRPPAPPLTGLTVTPGTHWLTLRWNAPANTANLTGYDVQYRRSDGGWFAHGDSRSRETTRVIDLGGFPPSDVHVRVRARFRGGVSEWTAWPVGTVAPFTSSGTIGGPQRSPPTLQGTTVWSATLTVGQPFGNQLGCYNSSTAVAPCTSALTDDDFTHDGVDYAINLLWIQGTSPTTNFLDMRLDKNVPSDLQLRASLYVGSRQFSFADDGNTRSDRLNWDNSGLSWSVGDTVPLRIVLHPPFTASLSVAPNPVTEGSPVRVTATLPRALSSDVTLPLTLTRGTADPGDYGALSGIFIPAGYTSAFGSIATNQDADADHETFTVELGTRLPVTEVDGPSSVEVTIRDDERIWPPTGLRVTLGSEKLTLRWNAPTGIQPGDRVVGYDVNYRRSDGGWGPHGSPSSAWRDVPSVRETTRVIDLGVIPPADIHVRVRARVRRVGGTDLVGDWATWLGVSGEAQLEQLGLRN